MSIYIFHFLLVNISDLPISVFGKTPIGNCDNQLGGRIKKPRSESEVKSFSINGMIIKKLQDL